MVVSHICFCGFKQAGMPSSYYPILATSVNSPSDTARWPCCHSQECQKNLRRIRRMWLCWLQNTRGSSWAPFVNFPPWNFYDIHLNGISPNENVWVKRAHAASARNPCWPAPQTFSPPWAVFRGHAWLSLSVSTGPHHLHRLRLEALGSYSLGARGHDYQVGVMLSMAACILGGTPHKVKVEGWVS